MAHIDSIDGNGNVKVVMDAEALVWIAGELYASAPNDGITDQFLRMAEAVASKQLDGSFDGARIAFTAKVVGSS